jgi:hypothetical protein
MGCCCYLFGVLLMVAGCSCIGSIRLFVGQEYSRRESHPLGSGIFLLVRGIYQSKAICNFMSISGQSATAKRRFLSWQGMLICLAILSLDAHLANRFQLPLGGAATVQANSPKVQHMDQDAYRWVPPPVHFSAPLRPVPGPPLVTEKRSYSSPSIPCLYDRPPPELA